MQNALLDGVHSRMEALTWVRRITGMQYLFLAVCRLLFLVAERAINCCFAIMPNVENVGESYVEYRVKTPMARFYWSAVTRASSLSGQRRSTSLQPNRHPLFRPLYTLPPHNLMVRAGQCYDGANSLERHQELSPWKRP